MAGAFLGAVGMWMLWIPHFKTVPEPLSASPSDNLLRKRDALPKNAIEISSYNPNNPWLQGLGRRRGAKKIRDGSSEPEKETMMAKPKSRAGIMHHQSQSQDPGTSNEHGHGNLSPNAGVGGAGGNLIRRIVYNLTETAHAWVQQFLYYAVRHDEFALPPGPAIWRRPSLGDDGQEPLSPAPTPSDPYLVDDLMSAEGEKSDSFQTNR